ncbi:MULTISPECIES: hypothetical protein [unclassified Ruegeria]|uniref:hypothetical protein n=1 Tax=unclassified Ruegeria TaxID=2625375 RepID=UPI001487ED20|nr:MULTISPECIES: hypothetical protein [unclassified Ruegeria]NOD62839.1 hypothetical protein [Ruegeria sp. HKCCD6109]
MQMLRWLFGSREPDCEKLLERTDAHIRIERAGGDVMEITPNSSARQKNGGGPQKQHHQNGNGQRPNGQSERDNQLFRR